MSRIYTVAYQGTLTAAGPKDLLELIPATNKPCKLRGMLLSQTSEIGDAQEEGLRIQVGRMSGTLGSGSGGSTVTPALPDSDDVAAGFTAECNNTTVATGTYVVIEELGWNVRNTPYEHWMPDDPFCTKAKNGQYLIVRLQTAPTDAIDVCITFWIEEE